MSLRIAVIGGGAAGFFSAIHASIDNNNDVVIFEKNNKILSKVRISGGGRCNVMHSCFDVAKLVEYYPRGKKELRNAFARFNTNHTLQWFESRGVKLKTEDDGRMFPVTDDSYTIIQCLMQESENAGVKIKMSSAIHAIEIKEKGFDLVFADGNKSHYDKVIITTGGSPQLSSYKWLEGLGHNIIPPAPSLFTFNIPQSPLKGLEGVSMQSVIVKLKDSKRVETGPVLITHWGISGPAVIKLSAWAARDLQKVNYESTVTLNWLPEYHAESARQKINQHKTIYHLRRVFTSQPFTLPQRLWERLCELSEIQETDNYADLSKAKINKLSELLTNMQLQLKGKTTYKEEFVTCGGVSLKEVDMITMESKKVKGIFFAGEILDIDGVTGGFNFQAAWTTGYLAGMNAGNVSI
jgi:predicted Rossmann fold flavoprotein